MAASQLDYEVIVERNIMVKMRDGARLATDVYHPARDGKIVEGKFPAVLVRTPYDKGFVSPGTGNLDYDHFTRHGYVVVVQDVRGRFKSDGEGWYHGVYEAEDGYDTIEWVAQQLWSNGKIGMAGISYPAAVQCAAAILNPPHLTAMFHVGAPSNYGLAGYREGGALSLAVVPIAFWFAASGKESAANPRLAAAFADFKLSEWLARAPVKRGCSPLKLFPLYENWLEDVMHHEDYDEFWKKNKMWAVSEYYDQHKDVAAYFVSGWYDRYEQGDAELYRNLSKMKKGPMKMLMGPWNHGEFTTYSGDVDFGAGSGLTAQEYNVLMLKWFDAALKGSRSRILDEPPVKIFVMGAGDGKKNSEGRMNHGGKWRYENEWPIARAKYTKYYIHAEDSLTTSPPGKDEAPSTYHYDPGNPVPTIGGSVEAYCEWTTFPGAELLPMVSRLRTVVPSGAFDQRERPDFIGCKSTMPLSSRHDVLVFATPPLTEDMEVTGSVVVKLYASSSAVDTDFTAKLIDVHPPNIDYPEGFAMNLTDGIIRGRYRRSFENPELMRPGEVYEFTIVLPPTSNLFTKSHQIRLDISSSNYPKYDVNPNTGESLWRAGRHAIAENTIHHDAKYPSHILFPIIPA